jgi:hypothetical protein
MRADHPWVLTAPWYRWQRPGDPRFGRQTAPLLQKYAAPTFVNDFLAEPQRSLRFKDEDFVHRIERRVPKPKFSLSPLVRVKTDRRKVFLDTHSRFYLVVFELHCDAPGFPSVGRDTVCEAGLVIRRRVAPAPPEARKALAAALDEVATLEAKLATARELVPAVRAPSARKAAAPGAVVAEALRDRCGEEVARGAAQPPPPPPPRGVQAAGPRGAVGGPGGVPREPPGFGARRAVEETPETVAEAIVPMYPLIPDPGKADHSAAGRTLWFAVLPTGGSDVDEAAAPRFDDRSLYEARCFVRRHKPGCPKTAGRADCKGELVWSRPTEVYQLAAAMDLDGTSNRPVTVQLPDLPALEAQAATQPPGTGVGVRMVSPDGSSLEFGVDPDNPGEATGASVGGVSICFFSIPLITIVATFVLKLFLPIVVFVFGLWFLLKLKFCILPSFELDAGLAFALDATPPGVDFDASLEVGIEGAFAANLGPTIAGKLKDDADVDLNVLGKLALDMSVDFSQSVPPDLAAGLGELPPGKDAPAAPLPALTARLEYYPRVEAVS